MRIVLIGGGTGGHFYPLIAISEGIEQICKERTLLEPELFYLGPKPFDANALMERDIVHIPSPAGSAADENNAHSSEILPCFMPTGASK